MSIERIVRPFQTGDVFNARRFAPELPALAPGDTEVALLEWKGNADANYVEAPGPDMLGFTAEWKEDRTRRVTDTVKVEQTGNPENFVTLERIKSMVIKNSKTREEIPIKMDWST